MTALLLSVLYPCPYSFTLSSDKRTSRFGTISFYLMKRAQYKVGSLVSVVLKDCSQPMYVQRCEIVSKRRRARILNLAFWMKGYPCGQSIQTERYFADSSSFRIQLFVCSLLGIPAFSPVLAHRRRSRRYNAIFTLHFPRWVTFAVSQPRGIAGKCEEGTYVTRVSTVFEGMLIVVPADCREFCALGGIPDRCILGMIGNENGMIFSVYVKSTY